MNGFVAGLYYLIVPHFYSLRKGVFRYPANSHSYDKVIYFVKGSITFGLPELGERLYLEPGDRMQLPAGLLHDAVVGDEGVVCLEAQR